MDYVRLGETGLKVSRLCLGCMTYGSSQWRSWVLDEAEAMPFFKLAIERGINFFDTANGYSDGTSEEILGRALKDFAHRADVVIATKVFGRMRPGPNGAGLSRKAIMSEIDASLRRLGTDYVDLYQLHRFDYDTSVEETLEALNDLVRAGKVRYVGASSMAAWQFANMLHLQRAHGWARFVSMQNFLNLLYREEEREMIPLCRAEGVGLIPWSPLARGKLARDWDAATERSRNDPFGASLFTRTEEADRQIAGRVAEIAASRGVPRAQIALAWVLARPGMSAPIIGATKASHLDDAIAATEITLTAEETTRLEELYVPHPVTGFA